MGNQASTRTGVVLEAREGGARTRARAACVPPPMQRLRGEEALARCSAHEVEVMREEFEAHRGGAPRLQEEQFCAAVRGVDARVPARLMVPGVDKEWFLRQYYFALQQQQQPGAPGCSEHDFQEAVAILLHGTAMQAKLVAFKVFDVANDGVIHREEFALAAGKLVLDTDALPQLRHAVEQLCENAFAQCVSPEHMTWGEFFTWICSDPVLEVDIAGPEGDVQHVTLGVRHELLGPEQEQGALDFTERMYVQTLKAKKPRLAVMLIKNGALEWVLEHSHADVEDVASVPLKEAIFWQCPKRLYYEHGVVNNVGRELDEKPQTAEEPLRCVAVQSPATRVFVFLKRGRIPSLTAALGEQGAQLVTQN